MSRDGIELPGQKDLFKISFNLSIKITVINVPSGTLFKKHNFDKSNVVVRTYTGRNATLIIQPEGRSASIKALKSPMTLSLL